jgi:hypothetical protein
MATDPLQSAWQQTPAETTNSKTIQSMIQTGNHPVLKRIRRQLIIETAAFAALLVVYYDIFDGDRKPFVANALLVAGLVLSIVHNLIGYRLTGRGMAAGCLLFFFSMAITYTTSKYWILAGIILFFAVQLFVLYRVWAGRIGKLQQTVKQLHQS